MMLKKLNILYHHRTQGRGAEGVHISSIVIALESLGHKVTVLSPPGVNPLINAGNAPVDKSNIKTSGIDSLWKFISKNLPNSIFEIIEIFYNIPSFFRLRKELANGEYDLIYERYAFYLIAGAFMAKRYKIPFILEANEVNGINDRARKQTFSSLCGYFERYLFNRCTSIHTVSSFLMSMIVDKGVSKDKVVVSPNAINIQKFCKHVDNSQLKTNYNLKDKIVIGFAGWFDDWDKLDNLVEIFAKLKNKHKNIVLLLIGDGAVLLPIRKRLVELKVDDSAILTGAVERSEVHKYMSLLDIAVITHSNEFGSPVVMFEFMGLKIPIVAPKLPPITDVLTNNINSLLFDVLDMDELTEKIETLLLNDQLRIKLSESAYEKLVADHTWENNAEHILMSSGLIN